MPQVRILLGAPSLGPIFTHRKSGREDSNLRPPAPKAGALPGCATPRLNLYSSKRIARYSSVMPASSNSGAMFRAIHAVVRRIPRGKVMTYGAVARAAGYPGATRQVVWALRAGSALPWHRVVGAKGKVLLPGEAGFEQRVRLGPEA